jgi:putative transposase
MVRHHHPPHVYLDNAWYVITAATVDRDGLLASEYAKEVVRDAIRILAPDYRLIIRAWVILDNHYHLWDTCIRTDSDLWTRFNYIHQNPVKHGYVQHLEEWRFSSYSYFLRTKGKEWMDDCWERYPVVDFLDRDDFGGPGTTAG